MAQPYVGEIRMFAGNFAPSGWMLCQGQLIPISEYETLFNLIGTNYGGDGQSTFALPDLRGRIPVHFGAGYVLGQMGGVEEVTLSVAQIPSHTHALAASTVSGNQINPQGNVPAASFNVTPYINESPDVAMNAASLTGAGGSQPHSNMQPYQCVNFIISLFGIFPSPS